MTKFSDNNRFEKYLVNSLSLRVGDMNYSNYQVDFEKIINSLSNREFTILFPFYWNHHTVEEFRNKFKENVRYDDYSWYLNTLSEVIKNRNIHWVEKINLFHCFGFTRYFDFDSGELISNGLKVNLDNVKDFSSLIDISAYTWISTKQEFDYKDIIPYLKILKKNTELISAFAMYQIYYYGGVKECLNILNKYLFDSKKSIVVPHTILSLLFVERNLIFEEVREEKEMMLNIFENLPVSVRDIVYFDKY